MHYVAVCGDAEDEGHIDVNAFANGLLDGWPAFGGAGDFNHYVGAVEGVKESSGLGECFGSV